MTKFWKCLTSRLTGKAPQSNDQVNRPTASPSPGGPNERSECRFICCSGVGRGEGGLNSQFKTQPSPFDHLPYNRNGKIAHLPRHLRDRINLALYNRCPAKDLARALNQMPEVQSVMAQYFNARPLISQNIYEWKQGGYRDWLHHRQILEQQRELTADAKDLSNTANGLPDSLFGILTLNYAGLLMNRDTQTPEEFEKKRKELSLVSQDISRMHRCHINTRRVEVQEARLERDEEKTEEQLVFKFVEWTENPAVRRACILEPMEKDRQMRKMYNMPPRPEDPLVERLAKNDPYFNPPPKKQTKTKPNQTEKSSDSSGTGVPPVPGSQSEPPPPPASEKAPDHPQNSPLPNYDDKTASQLISEIEGQREKAASPSLKGAGELKTDSPIRPIGPVPPNSKLNPQSSTLPKAPLSAYERALLAGKTFLEALYLHSAPESAKADSPRRSPARRDEDRAANPNPQPTARPPGASAWDSFSQPVDVYAGFRPAPDINFRSALGRNTLG
jgi:hypothetical protein